MTDPKLAGTRPLTDRTFWDERHVRESGSGRAPRPRTRHLDFELARFFDRHLRPLRGGAILEAGCGGSVWMPVFARRYGLAVTGVDYSERGLEACRGNLAAAGASAELIRGDLLDPGFHPGRTVDVVYSLGVLEHFSDPRAVIGRMAAFLPPGGLFLAWVPNPAGAATRISRRLDADYDRTHARASRKDWIGWLREAGLEVLEAYPAQFLDFSHIHVLRLPSPVRRFLGPAFRALSLPFLVFERAFRVRIGIGPLCSGLFLAAQRPRRGLTPR